MNRSRNRAQPAPRNSADVVASYPKGVFRRPHALLIVTLPTLAMFVAGWQIWRGEVQIWQPALAIALYIATMIGITVGFHRLFAHRAFQTSAAIRALLAILGSAAAQGPPIYWVANHRRHHRFSDIEGDPHSPHWAADGELRGWRGLWHAHVGWTFTHDLTSSIVFCKDLLQDRVVAWTNRYYYTWVLTGVAIAAAVGILVQGGWEGAWQGLLWGGGVRLFASYHLTNSINSVTHRYGYRAFDTPEKSCNNLWLGLPTLGEAWHNNHHACPSSAIFGLAWWEVDIGALVIRFLHAMKLAWNVRAPDAEVLKQKRPAGQRSDWPAPSRSEPSRGKPV